MFDLGGVLVENGGREALTALLPYKLEGVDVRERWLESPAVRLFERGQMASGTFAAAIIEEWRLELQPSEFIASFATWPKDFFPGAKELIAELKQHHRVACLSNSNAIHWERFPEVPTLFHASFPSHQIGCVKPDREAFAHALREMDAQPRDVYFFDDLAPNVAGAKAAGINAFQVEGISQIEPILRRERLWIR
jgi:putative hydrolase of the HAD superfamily